MVSKLDKPKTIVEKPKKTELNKNAELAKAANIKE
jgi:hypothetical protein